MLSDPQTITINAVAKTFNRISTSELSSKYATDDGQYKLTISHQKTKGGRVRHMIRLDNTVIAADPLTAENVSQSASTYIVIDEPNFGFTDTALLLDKAGFATWLSDANVGKVLTGQH